MTESIHQIGVRSQRPTEKISATVSTGDPSRNLTDGELRQLRHAVLHPPHQSDYPMRRWTRILVKHYVRDNFGVTYSFQFIERLVRAIGVAHRLKRSGK